MLRFFRQIRQRLLTDNKFSKYLLYAIGEILLVVIGILIALQVDNWNEKKQERAEELNYLSRLNEDLKVDNAYFKRRIDDANRYIDLCIDFRDKLFEKQKSMEEAISLWDLFRGFNESEMLTIQNSTYSEMLNAGKLELISDPGLKSTIIEYYRECEEAANHITEYNAYTVDVLNLVNDKAPNAYEMVIFSEKTDLGIEELFGYLNDPASDAFAIITYASGIYWSKHETFRDNYFKELEELSKELINQLEAYE